MKTIRSILSILWLSALCAQASTVNVANLPASTSAPSTALLILSDPAGVAEPTKITFGNLCASIPNLPPIAGSTAIVTLGTITAGAWNATPIADSYIASAATWSAKEPAITAGTTSQFWRGDKTWQTLNAGSFGLGNVENIALSAWPGSSSLTTFSGGTFGTAAASSASAFEVPLTFGAGLTRTTNTITVNGASITGLTASQVGLGSVNNTSDATKNAASVSLTNHTINGASNTITIRLGNDVTGILPVANGGNGTGSPGIVAGANVTVSGSWPTQTVAASGGGGGSIDWANTAFLSPDGDDGTGAVGDPSHPFATAQASFDSGAGTLVLWPKSGSYGAIVSSSAIDLRLIGYGETVSAIGQVSTTGSNVHLTGNGHSMVACSGVATNPLDGVNGSVDGDYAQDGTGATGTNGADGGAAGDVTLEGITTGAVYAVGSDGGTGGSGQNEDCVTALATGGNGGNGGAAGAGGSVTCTDCEISSINVSTGNPGGGGYGGNAVDSTSSGFSGTGGNGGNGGNCLGNAGLITLTRCTLSASEVGVAPSPLAAGSAGAGINGGSDGTDGSPGAITGLPGMVVAAFSALSTPTSGAGYSDGSNSYRFVIEAGVSIDTQN